MIEEIVEVGTHHVNGAQCHVPPDVLDHLDLEPGDTVKFSAIDTGCIFMAVDE